MRWRNSILPYPKIRYAELFRTGGKREVFFPTVHGIDSLSPIGTPYGITQNPDMGFLKNQLAGFMFNREGEKTYLIHDNSGELKWMDYSLLGIKSIAITPYSPNMNAFAERFVRSVRSECLDHFVVMNYSHLWNLINAYVRYYNHLRPHQGLDGKIPDHNDHHSTGQIKKVPVLFGPHHHYYRKAS